MNKSHNSNGSRAGRVRGFGVGLKIARVRAGMKQIELAEKLGVHATSVSQWERGDRADVPPRDVVETLESTLGANGELLRACGYAPMDEDTGAVATGSGTPGSTILLPIPGVLDGDDVRALLNLAERIAAAKTKTA